MDEKERDVTPRNPVSNHREIPLQEVLGLYNGRLRLVEGRIRKLFENRAPLIPLVVNHILAGGGKRLRPLFHLISADLAGYDGDQSIEVAAIIESIHTASLLHDDIVDMAEVRRGRPTANSLWGNQIVVLVGDFLYSNALRAAVMLKNQRVMEALSDSTTRMTEGELLQLNRIGDPDITEEEYSTIISAKTGALISAACRIGAILGGLPEDQENRLARFGMKTGIVFQMADDILDYMANEGELGKRLCKDLEEGKITLPLLYLLTVARQDDLDEIRTVIRDFSERGGERILELLKEYQAIEFSFQKARRMVDDAVAELAVFPDSQAKDALLSIAHYSLKRDK